MEGQDDIRAAAAWLCGRLRYLTRPHAQRTLYDALHAKKATEPDLLTTAVLNCHRRMGKSWLGVLLGVERCLRYPGQIVKYGAPTTLQCEEIVVPLLAQIVGECPPELRPTRRGLEYTFRNPAWGRAATSQLRLVGLNVEDGDRMRGGGADLVILDEVREVKNLRYLVKEVVLYLFSGRRDPLLVVVSTPPASMAHDFVQVFIPEATARGSYFVMPASANADWTAKDEELVLSEIGASGPDARSSSGYRREVLCELISDTESLIVPEFPRVKGDIVREHARPKWYQTYVGMDTGWTDFTGVALGYLDFREQIPVIEDEIWVNHATTGELAKLIRRKEHELGYDDHPRKVRRFADLTEQQLNDLAIEHHLSFLAVEKYEREAAIARFRTDVGLKRLRIHPRCKHLVQQLEHGVRKLRPDGSLGDFERNAVVGHFDLGMGLVYLHRSLSWYENPMPLEVDYDEAREWHLTGRRREPGGKKRIQGIAEAFGFGEPKGD